MNISNSQQLDLPKTLKIEKWHEEPIGKIKK